MCKEKMKFIQTLIILQGMLIIYKLIDEVDPSWTLLGLIHPKLVDLMMRVMPHRILNPRFNHTPIDFDLFAGKDGF